MTKSGMGCVDGEWRPTSATAELMADAVDGAVEFIAAIGEGEAQRGGACDGALVLELVPALNDRIDDAEGRLAERESGERCEVAVAELRRRRERLEALRRRGGVLASKQGAARKGSGLGRKGRIRSFGVGCRILLQGLVGRLRS